MWLLSPPPTTQNPAYDSDYDGLAAESEDQSVEDTKEEEEEDTKDETQDEEVEDENKVCSGPWGAPGDV